MGTCTISYLVCVAVSLYMAYLFTFRTYKMNGNEKTDTRITYPRLIYLFALVICFVPFLNMAVSVFFATLGIIGRSSGDFYIDSWFFDKPGTGKEG